MSARPKCEAVPVSIDDQVAALAEELPHQIERLRLRADAGKIHWGWYAIRRRQLTAALATLQGLQRQQDGEGRAS